MKRVMTWVLYVWLAMSLTAYADSCQAGSLSNVVHTTCSVGRLTFAFGSLSGLNVQTVAGVTDHVTGVTTEWSPDAFTFTPVVSDNSYGFTLSFSGGPVSISTLAGGFTTAGARLEYEVRGRPITQVHLINGASSLSVWGNSGTSAASSSHSFAPYDVGWRDDINGLVDDYGKIYEISEGPQYYKPLLGAGAGSATLIFMSARNGNGAGWDGQPETFMIDVDTVWIPEPSPILLLPTGLLFSALSLHRWRVAIP